jgi:hypothetical protein
MTNRSSLQPLCKHKAAQQKTFNWTLHDRDGKPSTTVLPFSFKRYHTTQKYLAICMTEIILEGRSKHPHDHSFPEAGDLIWVEDFSAAISITYHEFPYRGDAAWEANMERRLEEEKDTQWAKDYLLCRTVARYYWYVFPAQFKFCFENNMARLLEAIKELKTSHAIVKKMLMTSRYDWQMPYDVEDFDPDERVAEEGAVVGAVSGGVAGVWY